MEISGGQTQGPITAYVDESYRSTVSTYVLSSALVPTSRADDLRDHLKRLARGRARIHWRDRSTRERLVLAREVAAQGVRSVSWVTSVSVAKQQERARRVLLERAVFDLVEISAVALVLETRHEERNRHDRDALRGFQRAGVLTGDLDVSHGLPLEEPLLWLADVVAGAVGEACCGRKDSLAAFGSHAVVVDVPPR